MAIKSYVSGHEIYYDYNDNQWKYISDNKSVEECPKPCIRCGNKSTTEGHDNCIANLGRVVNACCGHGVEEGYIQFDNGVIIRGYFTVERI